MTQLITTSNDTLVPQMMAPSDEPPENPHSPARRLMEAVCRTKSLVVLCAALGGTIGAAMAIIKPNEYSSKSTFLMRAGSEQVAVTPIGLPEGFGGVSNLAENAAHLLTQIDLAKLTVKRLGVEKVLQPFRPADTDSDSWLIQWIHKLQVSLHERDPKNYSIDSAARVFLSNLRVANTTRRSTLLDVEYTANDPHLAQEILTVYMDAAQDFHIQLYANPTTSRMAKKSFEDAKSALTAAKKAFEDIKRRAGVTHFTAEYDRVQSDATGLLAEVDELEVFTIPQLRSAIAAAEKALKTTDEYEEKTVKQPREDPLIKEYAKLLSDLQLKLPRFKEGTSQHKSTVESIARAKTLLEEAKKRPVEYDEQTTSSRNPKYDLIVSQLATDRRELNLALHTRLPTKKAKLEAILKRREALDGFHDEFEQCKAALEAATEDRRTTEIAYSALMAKESMASEKVSAIMPTGEASFQPNRVGPKRGQMTLIGLFAGFAFAVGFIAVRALTDSTVRTPEEIEKMLGIRVLATLPELRRRHVRRHENRTLSGC